jgi:hypothetical protein
MPAYFKYSAILLVYILNIPSLSAQNIICNDLDKIKSDMKAIREKDQGIRSKIIAVMQDAEGSSRDSLPLFAQQMKIIDKENQQYIGKLLDSCGWPVSLTSIENNTIFLVIDHADISFMDKYFPVLKTQMEKGTVTKTDFFTLEDRMLMRKNQKQRYGTQSIKADGKIMIWPIEDPDKLDDRRKSAGFLPMHEYMKMLESTYGNNAVWDKNLTVDEVQHLKSKSPTKISDQ